MRKYLFNGTEVEVHSKFDDGFLVSTVYKCDDEDIVDEVKFFAGAVFDVPPKERIHKDIDFLNNKIELLKKELRELEVKKQSEQSTLHKISSVPGLDMVVNYLTTNFKYYMDDRLNIYERSSVYTDKTVSVDLVEGVAVLYHKEKYSDRRKVFVFECKEDAEQERHKQVEQRINNCQWEHQIRDMEILIDNDHLKSVAKARVLVINEEHKKRQIKDCKDNIEKYTEQLKKLTK